MTLTIWIVTTVITTWLITEIRLAGAPLTRAMSWSNPVTAATLGETVIVSVEVRRVVDMTGAGTINVVKGEGLLRVIVRLIEAQTSTDEIVISQRIGAGHV